MQSVCGGNLWRKLSRCVKWSGKQFCFQPGPENWQRRRWRDIRRQRIPCPRSDHRKCPVAVGSVLCGRHEQLCTGARPQSPSRVNVGYSTDVGGKVRWCQTVLAAISIYCQTECDSVWHAQPVKLAKQRCHVLKLARRVDEAFCCVHDWLLFAQKNCGRGAASQRRASVVQ